MDEEEEEIVISSWQQQSKLSDFPIKDSNESLLNTMKHRESKENFDMNPWLSEQDSKNRKLGQLKLKNEDDEIMLDDDTLSRLIEGDLKSDEENESFNKSRKPKPKPRHETNFAKTENQFINESPSKFLDRADDKESLFSGQKGLENKLFSGGKDPQSSADKLFSGGKMKENNDALISPRPVPHPRSKSKEKDSKSKNEELKSLNKPIDSEEITADQLFDSTGKSSKSVSFSEDSNTKSSELVSKEFSKHRSSHGNRTPPKKAPRSPRNTLNSSSATREISSDKNDSEETSLKEKQRPEPEQRHGRKHLKEDNLINAHSERKPDGIRFGSKNGSDRQYERNFNYDDNLPLRGDNTTGLKQRMHGDTLSHEGHVKNDRLRTPRREGRYSRQESKDHENSGLTERSHRYSKNEHRDSFGKDGNRNRDITDMFEDHVPANDEMVIENKEDKISQYNQQQTGTENKGRSPMKAHRALNEMTKSPDMYNFKYESRDSPQTDTFARSKGRSSSLTDLSSWKNSEFEHDEESVDSSGFTSSRSIRDAVYADWLQKKKGKLKETVKKKVEEKRKEEEKIKEKQEKEILAKKAFEAWNTKKVEVIKTGLKKKKEIQNKELDEKREKIIKKQDAKKYFESWKSKKDEVLKESYKEKKVKEREDKQKKIDDHKEKIEIAKKAYDKWKSIKDEQLKEEARSTRQAQKLKTKYEREADVEKRQECEKTFEEFLRKKGTGKRPPSPTLTQRAWSPGGITRGSNLIPEKVQPVIAPPTLNRSRSFSGMTKAMMSFNTTKRSSRGW